MCRMSFKAEYNSKCNMHKLGILILALKNVLPCVWQVHFFMRIILYSKSLILKMYCPLELEEGYFY